MNERVLAAECVDARRRVHLLLDGEPLSVPEREGLDRHLAVCAACRETEDELLAIQRALRDLPVLPLPDVALARVWARTSRKRRSDVAGWRRGWPALAAAALLAATLVGLWPSRAPDPAVEPSPVEVAQAAADARMVLGLTARALRRTERAALGDVLAGEVAPALRSVPVEWPAAGGSRRSRANGV